MVLRSQTLFFTQGSGVIAFSISAPHEKGLVQFTAPTHSGTLHGGSRYEFLLCHVWAIFGSKCLPVLDTSTGKSQVVGQ